MDQESTNQHIPITSQSHPIKPAKKKRNILFTIVFAVSFLIILLWVLNYFNIIRLSQTTPTPGSTQDQKLPSTTFEYDIENAENTIAQYIKETIKPEFLADNFDIKQGLTFDNTINEDLKHSFGTYIDNENENMFISFNLIQNSDLPNDFKIFIHPYNTEQSILDVDLANSLVSTYFLNPFPIENCSSSGTTTQCKTIKLENDGKREFGAIIGLDSSKSPPVPASTIFTCFISKENPFYNQIQSCVSPE